MTTAATISGPRDIVLIHGLWMTPLCWEGWIERFEKRGYRVTAPAWPGVEAGIEQVRRDPSSIAGLSITEIVDSYTQLIKGMSSPPIIMGHSFGGAFTEALLDRGLGAVGVAISPAPLRGVYRLPLSTLRSSWSLLRNPLSRHRAVPLNAGQFHYAFGNTLSREESDKAHERYAIPGPRSVLLEGAFANLNPGTAAKVNYKNGARSPLLLISGSEDHVVPAAVVRSTAGKYRKSSALTELRQFEGRSHFTLGQPGWEEVADYAIEWAASKAKASATAA